MEVADREHDVLLALRELRTDARPLLDPPVEGRAQKREGPLGHPPVFPVEQPAGDIRPALHPRLIGFGRLDDVAHSKPFEWRPSGRVGESGRRHRCDTVIPRGLTPTRMMPHLRPNHMSPTLKKRRNLATLSTDG